MLQLHWQPQLRHKLWRIALEAASVIRFWKTAKANGLDICIDGGWAVDAVLGQQTRTHQDLDIAVPADQVPSLREFLGGQGFVELERPDSWEHNFVLADGRGQVVDVHSYVLNPAGGNAGGVPYEARHLTGEGRILGTMVRCVPPEWLVAFHTGYEVDQTDWHDVRLLCRRFGIPIPEEFQRFRALP